MLAEINFCANRLQLPVKLPVEKQDIRREMVFAPRKMVFAGRLDTSEYSFSFARSGRLRFITKLDNGRGDKTLREYLEGLAKIKSTINTTDAYRIATNWCAAMEIDLPRLEREHPPIVRQQAFVPWEGSGNTNAEVPLPIFDVKWGDWAGPVIDIQISGATGELLILRQEDVSYSKRPASLINDMDKLLAIPDEEFLKMSPLEKSDLVIRFAAIHYSAMDNSSHDQTNAVSLQPEHK
ncbi:MAG: hypothetical protein WDM80_01175 [Limisphaerales bacterium]